MGDECNIIALFGLSISFCVHLLFTACTLPPILRQSLPPFTYVVVLLLLLLLLLLRLSLSPISMAARPPHFLFLLLAPW